MGEQIKLRAWLPGIGKMTYAHTLDEWIKMGPTPINDAREGLVWLRWTGLKDKNGTEIYEGDIAVGEHAMYSILWNDRMAKFMAKVERTKSVLIRNNSFPLWQYVEGDGECRFQVIGNIHQHPELLKEGDFWDRVKEAPNGR